jgi:hypothetical protein
VRESLVLPGSPMAPPVATAAALSRCASPCTQAGSRAGAGRGAAAGSASAGGAAGMLSPGRRAPAAQQGAGGVTAAAPDVLAQEYAYLK